MAVKAIYNVAQSSFSTCSSIKSQYPLTVTTAKVQRAALYALAAATVAAGAYMLKSVAIYTTYANPFVALTAFGAAAALVYCAKNIKDYHDPAELSAMRKETLEESFSESIKKHGFQNIELVESFERTAAKGRAELMSGNFSEVVTLISPDAMKTYQFISDEEFKQYSMQELIDRKGVLTRTYLNHLKTFGILSQEEIIHLEDACELAEKANDLHRTEVRASVTIRGKGGKSDSYANIDYERIAAAAIPYAEKLDSIHKDLTASLQNIRG